MDTSILEQLLQQVEAANGIVDACTKPGGYCVSPSPLELRLCMSMSELVSARMSFFEVQLDVDWPSILAGPLEHDQKIVLNHVALSALHFA